jgi:hypothetical protein
MAVGDLFCVGSMGVKYGSIGWPVLILSISGGWCMGLINGSIRPYSCSSLRKFSV